MPSIKDESTVEAVAREYCSNGRDKAQGMRTIGYAESSCKSGKAVKDVYGNLRVIAAIKRIDTKSAQIGRRTIKSLDVMYQEAYDAALCLKQPSAMVSAVTGIARLYGMDKDNEVGGDKATILTAEQAERYSLMAAAANRDRIKISKEVT